VKNVKPTYTVLLVLRALNGLNVIVPPELTVPVPAVLANP
jgi:hypothetical protein